MIAEELYALMKRDEVASPDRYMGAAEAAAMLGWSAQTLYNRIREMPHVKNGKRLTFSEKSLKKYIETRA